MAKTADDCEVVPGKWYRRVSAKFAVTAGMRHRDTEVHIVVTEQTSVVSEDSGVDAYEAVTDSDIESRSPCYRLIFFAA